MGTDRLIESLQHVHESALHADGETAGVVIDEFNDLLKRFQARFPDNTSVQSIESVTWDRSAEAREEGSRGETGEAALAEVRSRSFELADELGCRNRLERTDRRRTFPDTDTLIKAYEQFSEESRYRDRIMHNSYYLVLIGFILLAGNLLSADITGHPVRSFDVGFVISVGALVAIGISVVMKLYDRKCMNAEEQRAILEKVLDRRFTREGIYKEVDATTTRTVEEHRDGTRLDQRENDNPFVIQQTVMWETEDPLEETFLNKASLLSTVFALSGTLLLLIGALIVINSQLRVF